MVHNTADADPEAGRAGTTKLLGLDFSDLNVAETAAWIANRPADAPFGFVVTPNAEHLVRLAKQPELMAVYRQALLRLMDSRVVLRAAQLLGLPALSLVPGSDLTVELLTKHLRPDDRITVIGLWPRDLPLLKQRLPQAIISHYFPPLGFERDETAFQKTAEFVVDHPARFYIFACGMPRQELLGARLKACGNLHGTALCVGSALEFLIGSQQRAPVKMQRAGLEWLHRLCREPRRLGKRYLIQSPPIFTLLLRERIKLLKRRADATVDETGHS